MNINKVNFTTWEVEEILQAFGVIKNEISGACGYSVLNEEECQNTIGFDIGHIETTDNEIITLYFCKECEKLSYFIVE